MFSRLYLVYSGDSTPAWTPAIPAWFRLGNGDVLLILHLICIGTTEILNKFMVAFGKGRNTLLRVATLGSTSLAPDSCTAAWQRCPKGCPVCRQPGRAPVARVSQLYSVSLTIPWAQCFHFTHLQGRHYEAELYRLSSHNSTALDDILISWYPDVLISWYPNILISCCSIWSHPLLCTQAVVFDSPSWRTKRSVPLWVNHLKTPFYILDNTVGHTATPLPGFIKTFFTQAVAFDTPSRTAKRSIPLSSS